MDKFRELPSFRIQAQSIFCLSYMSVTLQMGFVSPYQSVAHLANFIFIVTSAANLTDRLPQI